MAGSTRLPEPLRPRRTQLRALFDEVLARTSSLTYAGPPSYLRSNFQRGVKRLPVAWTA